MPISRADRRHARRASRRRALSRDVRRIRDGVFRHRAAATPPCCRRARSRVARASRTTSVAITTYAALGAIVGGTGGAALSAADWLVAQRILFVVANLFLLALHSRSCRRATASPPCSASAPRCSRWCCPSCGHCARAAMRRARFALGTIWGLVPCGLVYGVLPIALFAGGAWQGALVMLAFGIGTLPNLLAAGWIVARARAWFDSRAAALRGGVAARGVCAGRYRARGIRLGRDDARRVLLLTSIPASRPPVPSAYNRRR